MREFTESTFLTPDGTKLFYRYWPAVNQDNGKKAIILFHRGHEHSVRIAHVVDEIEMPDYAFFAWDARGNGLSEGVRGDAPSFAYLLNDAQAFFQYIKKQYGYRDEDIAVIGQSVGAVIASAWVHDYVPNIRALVAAAPAFKVKLYVPFSRFFLNIFYNLRGNFFVNSYVKPKLLTHDKDRIASYKIDPLVTRPISARVLLDLYTTSDRVIADANSITLPTQVLISEKDYVVHKKPQKAFFESLASEEKELHEFEGFYHDTLGEKNRSAALQKVKAFIEKQFTSTPNEQSLLESDKSGYTYREYVRLMLPAGIFKRPYWWLSRKMLSYAGCISSGIKLGKETGFDSGSTLDYVYRNNPDGASSFGRLVDYFYLQSIGWRGIRQRKVNLESTLSQAFEQLKADGKAIKVLDIAAGHGRYVIDTVSAMADKPEWVKLQDFSTLNVEKGQQLIKQRGLQNIISFREGDAFDADTMAKMSPKPNLIIVSGLYELFGDNEMVSRSLQGAYDALEGGGYLIYTGQPWHPQLEFIARVLSSHRDGIPWIMRRRTQNELDQLVKSRGFAKQDMRIDRWGIFNVSLAQKPKNNVQ